MPNDDKDKQQQPWYQSLVAPVQNAYQNYVAKPAEKVGDYLGEKLGTPAQFSAGLDRIGDDLERAGLRTHTPLFAGTGWAMKNLVPHGNTGEEMARSTALGLLPMPGPIHGEGNP